MAFFFENNITTQDDKEIKYERDNFEFGRLLRKPKKLLFSIVTAKMESILNNLQNGDNGYRNKFFDLTNQIIQRIK